MFRSNSRPLLVILAAGVSLFGADRKLVDQVRRANAQFLKAIDSGDALRHFAPGAFQSPLTEKAQCFPGTRPEMSQREMVMLVLQWLKAAPWVPPGTNTSLITGDSNVRPDNDPSTDGFSVFVIDRQRLESLRALEQPDDDEMARWVERSAADPQSKVAMALSLPKGLLLYALWQKKGSGPWKIAGMSPTCD